MKSFACILVCISTVVSVVYAQSALLEAEAAYPPCALKCMAEFIPLSPCNITDFACICSNVPLNANISICATTTCTIKETLTTKNVSSTLCGAPFRDKTHEVSSIGVTFGVIALIAFFLRLSSRFLKGEQSFGFDDATMALLVALAIPPTVFSVLLANNGLGKDIWTIPFDDITALLYYYFLGESFYLAAIAVNKIAILLLIFRVFGREGSFRKYIYILIGLCTAYGVSFVFATVFQCSPISYSWNQWDGEHEGTCGNTGLQGWLSSGFNIALDLCVIALPMPKLFALNMSWKKKGMVVLMFSLGILVTVVSIVRLRSLIQFANSQNTTWDYVPAAYWSLIEVDVGIICACLPAVRSLLIRAFPKIMDSQHAQSTNNTTSMTGKLNSAVKGPYSTPADRLSNTDRDSFIPLVDVERQDGKFLSQVNVSERTAT